MSSPTSRSTSQRSNKTPASDWSVNVKLGSHWIIFRTGLDETRLDEILEELYTQADTRERSELWGLVRLGKAFTVVAVDKETQCGEAGDEELRAR